MKNTKLHLKSISNGNQIMVYDCKKEVNVLITR